MKEYEYRVTALNDGGESDPSDGSKPIKAKKLKEAPKVIPTWRHDALALLITCVYLYE